MGAKGRGNREKDPRVLTRWTEDTVTLPLLRVLKMIYKYPGVAIIELSRAIYNNSNSAGTIHIVQRLMKQGYVRREKVSLQNPAGHLCQSLALYIVDEKMAEVKKLLAANLKVGV